MEEEIWLCNIKPADVRHVTSCTGFWADVLEAWAQVNYTYEVSSGSIIWWNSNIRIKNKLFIWPEPYRRGLRTLSQLFKNNTFISFKEAYNSFSLSIMQVNALRSICCKIKIVNEVPGAEPFLFSIMDEKRLSKVMYDKIMSKRMPSLKNKSKWESILNIDISTPEWWALFEKINKTTSIGKYRSFQYRLLHRAIITNKDLCRWKMKENEKCSFCQLVPESIVHLFYECHFVKRIHEQVAEWVHQMFPQVKVALSAQMIMFNEVVKDKRYAIVNPHLSCNMSICIPPKMFK